MKILVSACLLVVECRYCGTGYPQNKVIELVKNEAVDKFVVNYTESFRKGANETLKIAQLLGIKYAILKANRLAC